MAEINWDEVESKFGNTNNNNNRNSGNSDLKYADAGEYTAHVTDVEVRKVSTGSVAVEFRAQTEDDLLMGRATHWLSLKNPSWRQHHFKDLFVVLGATEEKARKAVEQCESKDDEEKMIEAYARAFERLVKEFPEVKVIVYKEEYTNRDGQKRTATRFDFMDRRVRMYHPERENAPKPEDKSEDAISTNDLPF